MTRKRIGILGFDGVASIDLAGPIEAFGSARAGGDLSGGASCYEVIVIGRTSKTFVSETGITFRAHKTLSTAPDLDTIVVPGGAGLRFGDTITSLSAWLLQRAPHTRRIAAVRSGIYPLAESGLLDHRHVTTHWRFARDLSQRFPKARVNFAASFVQDGQFYSCATPSAAIEMVIALIDQDFGSEVAFAAARELAVRVRPPTSDERLLDDSEYQSAPTDRLAELPSWIRAHLSDQISVEVLAARACVCPRHFSRIFTRAFHRTPAEFVEELRISEARARLSFARDSVERIAHAVGFNSADAFRRAFERRTGVNPIQYRTEIRAQNILGTRVGLRDHSRHKALGVSGVAAGRTGSSIAVARAPFAPRSASRVPLNRC